MDTTGDLTFAELFSQWFGWIALVGALSIVLSLIAAIIVARKAGYSHWLGIIAVLVPGAGPLMFLFFALAKWPVVKQRDEAIALLESKGATEMEIADVLGKELEEGA